MEFDESKPFCVCRMNLMDDGDSLSIRCIESQHRDPAIAAAICEVFNAGCEDAYYLPIDATGADGDAVLHAFNRQHNEVSKDRESRHVAHEGGRHATR